MNKTWWLQLGDLDEDQQAIINLPIESDCLVIGPPGSGKTNLLLLRASFLSGSGHKNYSIVTFTRVLKEFLSSGAMNYGVAADNAQTYFSWAHAILSEYGIEVKHEDSFEETRKNIHKELEKLSKIAERSSYSDFILIDEIQDYTQKEIETIRKFTKYIYAVGDSKQRIYISDDTIIEIRETFKQVRDLKFHYRNGLKICRLADGILNQVDIEGCMEATSQYNEEEMPSSVKLHTCLTLEDQVNKMLLTLETQLIAYPDEPIGILVPKNEDLSSVIAMLQNSNLVDKCIFKVEKDYSTFDKHKRIIVGTVHSTKGMEFRACHFLSAESVKDFRSSQKKLAFTACTRAKTSLNVYHSGNLPPYFEQAFANLEARPAEPPINELFPICED